MNGVSTDYAAVRRLAVASGRLFDDEADVRAMRTVAVIGQSIAGRSCGARR